jgi:hypothetical protein
MTYTMTETPRRKITVTSSLNEISAGKKPKRVVVKGGGGVVTYPPPPL